MSYFGGFVVGLAAVFAVLIPLCTKLTRANPGRKRWPDRAVGLLIGVVWIVLITLVRDRFWPDRSRFLDGLFVGFGFGPLAFAADIGAVVRHRRAKATEGSAPAAPEPRPEHRFVVPVAFSEVVQYHFADPIVRARYVIAAYRRGLIAPEYVPGLAADLAPLLPDGAWAELAGWRDAEGMDAVVDRAAGEIGYELTDQEERDEVTERLIYAALCSTDPEVLRGTAEQLGLLVDRPLTFDDIRFRSARVSSVRASLEGYFDAAHGTRLDVGVHRHFAQPAVRARHLIAAYRRDRIGSAEVPHIAAEVLADLPGAGPAWTELAMASPTAWRSDLAPIVDRAATEIGYDRADEEAILVEHDLYRGLVDGDVVERSWRIWGVDESSPFAVPWILAGHEGDVGIGQFFADGAALLNAKYGSA